MARVEHTKRFDFTVRRVEDRVDEIRKVRSPQWAVVKRDNVEGREVEICRGVSESAVWQACANERGRHSGIVMTREVD